MKTKVLLIYLCICCAFLLAEEKDKSCDPKLCLEEKSSVTTHKATINGKAINYEATAGTLLLKDDKGKTEASLFYVSYVKQGTKSPEDRPVTFCFNGGPGSSSVWLHLGFFGPKKVAMDTFGNPLRPYHLEDNEFSPLDITDIVFIDPISTGYSRVPPEEDPKKFHSVKEDIKSVGEFIRLWLTKNSRWTSPKYIAGESYGTTRAAGLANHLQEEFFIDLNGVILISAALDFQSIYFRYGNDLPFITFLPTYTNTAWFHKKLPNELQKDLMRARREVVDFATNEYALALLKGDLLSQEERQTIAEKLSRLTGISTSFILKNNLRIDIFSFTKQLLEEKERVVGRFDSRFTGIALEPSCPKMQYDPSMEVVVGAFTATINQYLRDELKWVDDTPYQILADVHHWDYGSSNQYLNMNKELYTVMTKDPFVRVFVANGNYDLATPYYATAFTVNHLGLDKELIDHLQMHYYDAGHMPYTHRPSLIKLKKDLASFYAK